MAKKKKKDVLPPCLHCGVVFFVVVKWCAKCEDHIGDTNWTGKHETCDDCASGRNDAYLKHKKGSPARVAKALEDMKDPANWGCDTAVKAYEHWIASPEYARRFGHD